MSDPYMAELTIFFSLSLSLSLSHAHTHTFPAVYNDDAYDAMKHNNRQSVHDWPRPALLRRRGFPLWCA